MTRSFYGVYRGNLFHYLPVGTGFARHLLGLSPDSNSLARSIVGHLTLP